MSLAKYKIRETRPQSYGIHKVWNVERWEEGRFTGGLRRKDKSWEDPMIGSNCDFKTLEEALVGLLGVAGLPIEIERSAYAK